MLEGRILGLDPTDANRPASAALIWTSPMAPVDRFDRHEVTLVPDDVGDFQLQIFGRPDRSIVETLDPPADLAADPPTAALAFLAVLDGDTLAPFLSGSQLRDAVRGASGDHYVLWVHRPAAARAALSELVLNPDALAEGMNLVLGFCRPGRDSQLLVVPPERVSVVGLGEIRRGGCIDVFWGDWR